LCHSACSCIQFSLYYLKLCILLLLSIAIEEEISHKYCWRLSTTWYKRCRLTLHCDTKCKELEQADHGACGRSSLWSFRRKCYCGFKCWNMRYDTFTIFVQFPSNLFSNWSLNIFFYMWVLYTFNGWFKRKKNVEKKNCWNWIGIVQKL